jgi:alkylation response protein AidB-like acyl-CoA dehydrogenase
MSILEANRTPSTPSVPAPATTDPAALVASARRIGADASARADEIEAARTMPIDLVRSMREAGLLRLMLPVALGGLEVEPATVVDVIEAISHGDGSAGWTAMIGNGSFFFAYFDPQVARRMIGDGDVTCAGAFAPSGRAVEVAPATFEVDGRWTFNSGVNHAEWLFEGVLVSDGGPPRLRRDGQPDWRFAAVPRDLDPTRGSIAVIDTWHALGLRGTGSNDVVFEGVTVPEEHTVLPFVTQAPHDGPLWRFEFMGLLGTMMVGVPLGIGRRALDEIIALAPSRVRPSSGPPNPADRVVHHRIGKADARLRAARALVDDALGSAWATACRGDRPDAQQHALLHLAGIDALEAATAAATLAFALGGSKGAMDGSVLQRCLRDLHTAGLHAAFAADPHGDWARGRLGSA